MKLLTTLCFISGIVFVQLAHARQCPNKVIDYKKFPGVKSEKDVSRNQDSAQWCEHFSAADLLCYHFNRKANWTLKDQCSAADLRMTTGYKGDDATSLVKNGGWSNFNKEYKNQGICPERLFPSEFENNKPTAVLALFEKLDAISDKVKTEGRPSVDGLCPECAAITPEMNSHQIIEYLKKKDSAKDAIIEVNKKVCDGKRIGEGLKVEFEYAKGETSEVDREKYYRILDQLDQENPVQVGMSARRLNKDLAGGHALLAIGAIEMDRGTGNMECYIVMKNSWGVGCDYISQRTGPIKSLICDPKTGLLYMRETSFLSSASAPVWIKQ